MKHFTVVLFCTLCFSFVVPLSCQPIPAQEKSASESTVDAQESNADVEPQSIEPISESFAETFTETPNPSEILSEDASVVEPISEVSPTEPSPDPVESAPLESSPEADETKPEAIGDGGSEPLAESAPEPLPESAPESTVEITPDVPTTTLVQGTLKFFLDGSFVQGADVCIDGVPTSCVKSSATGEFQINDFPVGKDAILTISDAQAVLYPMMIFFHIPKGMLVRPFFVGVVKPAELNGLSFALSGKPLDPTKGTLVSDVFDSIYGQIPVPLVGTTVSLTPQSGDGPYYPNNPPTTSSTSTTSAGLAAYFHVSTGPFALSYTHATKTCKASPVYQQDANGQSTGLIRAGWLSLIAAFCN
jgi:hypothetical protein